MGSAVTPEDLTWTLEQYHQAGLGGVDVIPIYGVAGYEEKFIRYLSPEWMAMLEHTLDEAERLDMGVDMATGTGWPFGGPWVGADTACKNMVFKTWELEGGERLGERVRLEQTPMVRRVVNQVYQIYGTILGVKGEPTKGSWADPQLLAEPRRIDIGALKEPIAANENLQALALDQVRFAKPLPLQALIGYSSEGQAIDLTGKVDGEGKLDWVAPAGRWTLYALFQGWHGKMVERAAPGGEGNVIDHFSAAAIRSYLSRFDEPFAAGQAGRLRAFFNDSYEVDDASGQSDWTPRLFEEFEQRRGYDLREHLPALFGKDSGDNSARVLTDYRETISDLLLDTFTTEWREWAKGKGAVIRNQAHGSPGNVLDLYAASDIPETEGTDMMRIKFASSAAHVTGKRLTSAEAATWLNEHFLSTLADVKRNLDRYLLGGVNHIFYHGSNYSPREAPWPGWLFYAAVHFNPRNTWWTDFATLNHYVTRVQSFLQTGRPDNDVLLYLPMHDRYAERGEAMLVHFEGMETFAGTPFETSARTLEERGYGFDFISDRLLRDVRVGEDQLRAGDASYQTIVVPHPRLMPLATLEKLIELARGGARVVVLGAMPIDVPGWGGLEARRQQFRRTIDQIAFAEAGTDGIREAQLGAGAFLMGQDLEPLLARAGVERETMVDRGLRFIRRVDEQGSYYFVANWADRAIDGWVPLRTDAGAVALFDPMREQSGFGQLRAGDDGRTDVYLQLAPGETCVVRMLADAPGGPRYDYREVAGDPVGIAGPWKVRFVTGGPERPADIDADTLVSWTDFGGEAEWFSGTLTYSANFARPAREADLWWLDLGQVHESARVRLNDRDIGTLIGPPYRIAISSELLAGENVIEISVSNLMANRIADLERRGQVWKRFYNVNFPARLARNRGKDGLFTAADWDPAPSGLLGPVTLTPTAAIGF